MVRSQKYFKSEASGISSWPGSRVWTELSRMLQGLGLEPLGGRGHVEKAMGEAGSGGSQRSSFFSWWSLSV